MKRIVIRMAVPVATALFVAGCCSSSQKTASLTPEAQGAPAVGQTTEVTAVTGKVETTTEADIQLHKEEMIVGKRDVSNGGVLIRTAVQTENVSQPVELRREEYVIERIPASEASAREAALKTSETAFQAREIYIPLTREEPVASKRTLLTEKVQLGKRIETDRQTVSSPVRSEDVEITKVAGKAAGGSYWTEPATAAAAAPGGTNALSLLREEMIVGKTIVDNGGVKLQKVVRTQVASQPIELKREEYTIDRSPLTDPQVAAADFTPKELRMTLSREEAVVGTRTQPTEFVRVRKQIHTDTQTVSGTVRKENLEIVKLTPEQAMGGTGAAGQSGATVISESGTPKEITVTGTAVCGKCELHETAACQNVIQVKEGDKTLNYYVAQSPVSKAFHENVCRVGRKVTATGTVREVAGKLELTPSKIDLTE